MERRRMLVYLGAELILTPRAEGIKGAITAAQEQVDKIDGAVMPMQFENPSNPAVHYYTTGPEIWRDTDGAIDIFVSGVGTGGTITGVSEVLRERKLGFQAIAVEPANSPVITQRKAGEDLQPGKHTIQGIGAGFIPDVLNVDVVDDVVLVKDEDAAETERDAHHFSQGHAVADGKEVRQHHRDQRHDGHQNRGQATVDFYLTPVNQGEGQAIA